MNIKTLYLLHTQHMAKLKASCQGSGPKFEYYIPELKFARVDNLDHFGRGPNCCILKDPNQYLLIVPVSLNQTGVNLYAVYDSSKSILYRRVCAF
jgi:hypothetical protein